VGGCRTGKRKGWTEGKKKQKKLKNKNKLLKNKKKIGQELEVNYEKKGGQLRTASEESKKEDKKQRNSIKKRSDRACTKRSHKKDSKNNKTKPPVFCNPTENN